jgi:hypothetical protein
VVRYDPFPDPLVPLGGVDTLFADDCCPEPGADFDELAFLEPPERFGCFIVEFLCSRIVDPSLCLQLGAVQMGVEEEPNLVLLEDLRRVRGNGYAIDWRTPSTRATTGTTVYSFPSKISVRCREVSAWDLKEIAWRVD